MKLTNVSKGNLSLWIGGDAVELSPGDSTRDLTAEEASALASHPVVAGWMASGLLTSGGAAPSSAPSSDAAAAVDEPVKPRRKRVTVQDEG